MEVVVADLSTNDQEIWKELKGMGFGGLPVNLLYPAKPGARPEVLPTRLKPKDIEAALERVTAL